MKRKLNIFTYIILALIVFQNTFFGVTFAEDAECYVCSRMSNEMQMYVNFQVEMISALGQVRKDREMYSGLTQRGLFSYGALSAGANFLNSLKSSINKTTQSAVNIARSMEYATAIVTKNVGTIAFSAEGLGDMLILFRQKTFMRDRNTLLEIDGSIDDLLWEVGMQGMLRKPVSSDIMVQLNEIASKYTASEPIFDQFQINGNATYEDLIMMLDSINRLMKNFFSVESLFVYKKNVGIFEKKISEGEALVVALNHEYLTKLSESYACVKGVNGVKNCGGSLTTFVSDVSYIGTDVKTNFENAWKQIKDSSKKLAEASKAVGKVAKNKYTNGGDLGLTDDQLELLRTVYGINTSKLTKQQGLSLATILNGSAGKNIKNSFSLSQDLFDNELVSQKKDSSKTSKEELTDDSITEKDFNKFSTYIKQKSCMKRLNRKGISDADLVKWKSKCLQELGENDLALKDNISSYVEYYIPNARVQNFTGMIDYLNESIENTLSELDLDKAVVMYSQNLDTTRYFIEIGAYIHYIVDNVIGSKNGSSKSIVNNLGKACETQCGNKGGMCYN